MTYSRIDDKTVNVEFSVGEFALLLAILGAAHETTKDKKGIQIAIKEFIRELNRTNVDFAFYAAYRFPEKSNEDTKH